MPVTFSISVPPASPSVTDAPELGVEIIGWMAVDELADEYDGKIKIGKVNIDEYQGLAAEYGVRAIPTLLVFNKGQVAEQMIGAKSKRDLKASLDRIAI